MTVPAGEGAERRRRSSRSTSSAAIPIAVNGKKLDAGDELIAKLNKIGGKHGVGVTVLVGEPPGRHEIPRRLRNARRHDPLRSPQGPRANLHRARHAHYKQQVALRYAELVYNGQWFHPLREALQTFIDHTNATVTGTAKVRLFKGRAMQVGADSPHTLYDPQLASFSMEGYDVTAARGFIDLFGLPMKVRGLKQKDR